MSLLSKLPGGRREPLHDSKGVVPAVGNATTPKCHDVSRQVATERHPCRQQTQCVDMFSNSIPDRIRLQSTVGQVCPWQQFAPLVLDEWNLRHKPVLLMRHPLDVVMSQVKAFGERPTDINPEIVYPKHVTLHNHWGRVKEISDPIERQLHLWCLLNAPLWQSYAESDDVVAIHYHDLIVDPEHRLKDVLCQLDWRPQRSIENWSVDSFVAGLDLRETSDTDFQGDFLANQQDQLWKNIKRLTPEEKRRYQNVLDTYGLTLYSMHEVKPNSA